MLYKKNNSEKLSKDLFKNPTSEYRGTPFWAWNCRLEKEELKNQIDIFKQMGFGGFHMHVRTGLETPYLSDEYMDIVKSCTEKAKNEDMLAWLYDEDRWASGAAGGFVTKDKKYREKYIRFTPNKRSQADEMYYPAEGEPVNAADSLLAAYEITLDGDGYLVSYRRIGKDESGDGNIWYAYPECRPASEWFNNQSYLDTLNKDAVNRFVEVTHERYKQCVGGDFGATVPAIFTDEPQFMHVGSLDNSFGRDDILLPWTDSFFDLYKEMYSSDALDALPEFVWEKADGSSRVYRYRWFDCVSELFASSFAGTIGGWCDKNGIALTGHLMAEESLYSQSVCVGEAMRSYKSFGLPGIDMLCNHYEFTTAKQTQSVVNQCGKEGMLSELYGVTGWDFDFRGHKLQGDWQAALGVTVRVPHLSWVSMAGEAKRDYPASIHYQSPWYTEYSYVEDHFARVNTAMTRGKPKVRVGVIHPIESYWLHFGPDDKTSLVRNAMDDKFHNMTDWLLAGSIDFDFISESSLPSMCEKGSNPLKVGEMSYDAIVVPDCETLRSTTLERLEKFREDGGKLIFMGGAPKYENAEISDRGKLLFDKSECISFGKSELITSLNDVRDVTIKYASGEFSDNLIYRMRSDNDCDWLFIAHCRDPYNKDVFSNKDVRITVNGERKAEIYDTLTGEIYPADAEYTGGKTVIKKLMYDYDSLLIRLSDGKNEAAAPESKVLPKKKAVLPAFIDYTLDEPNVLLLDMCEYKVDEGEYFPTEEILRADNAARKCAGLNERSGRIAQPWVIPAEEPSHSITLRFTVNSEIEINGASLALEDAEKAHITFNGNRVDNTVTGWYVDKAIKTLAMPKIEKGENILTIKLPLGSRTSTEWCYLLGDFGVNVYGKNTVLTPKKEKLAFGDITTQGLPFYGGNITYSFEAETESGSMTITVPRYRGGLVKAFVDGREAGYIVYSPNTLTVDNLENGRHSVELRLYTNRFNSFGAVHNSDNIYSWQGPPAWRTENERWSYEYNLKPVGILTTPEISV